MSVNQQEGMEFLGGLCADLDEKLSRHSNGLTFAVVFWNRGKHEDPKSVALFSPPDDQAAAPYAVVTAAHATRQAGSGLELHGLDTPERVCFYEQDFYVLSSFSAFSLQWKRYRFDTLEHAYHWEKFPAAGDDPLLVAHAIRTAPSAHEAFRLAQEHKRNRRHDWDDVKVDIMRQLIRAKAEQHEYVRRKLLQTGERELVENSWRDDFWGWGPNRDGQNMLGKLWMELRAELRGAGQ